MTKQQGGLITLLRFEMSTSTNVFTSFFIKIKPKINVFLEFTKSKKKTPKLNDRSKG
jgi:hypothetical protein